MASERRISSISKSSVSMKTDAQQKANVKEVKSGLKYAISWVAYVLIGSWIFLVLEESTSEVKIEHEKWARFKELVTIGKVVDELHELKKHLTILCPHEIFDRPVDELNPGMVTNETHRMDSTSSPENASIDWIAEVEFVCDSSFVIIKQVTNKPQWSIVDAIYYTMTLVTTIGFGHIFPTTDVGKLFCIPYALVGVPLTCILMAKTSDLLSNRMLTFYETMKKRYRKHPKMLLWGVTWLFLIVGCFVFMFLPSVVFAILENWSYIDSFYFTFITLSTIGFGDYIAGYSDSEVYYLDAYKVLIVVWIMIALGYWIFLLNFLQKAIKSNAKTLRKTFRGKTISKQAEFIKHLIAKVTQPDETEEDDDYDKRLHMMALIVESLSESTPNLKAAKSFNSIHSNRTGLSRTSICRSAKHPEYTAQDRLQLMTKMVEAVSRKPSRCYDSNTVVSEPLHISVDQDESAPEIREEDWQRAQSRHAITFQDLMKVKVSVKTEMLPGFETLMEQSGSHGWVLGSEDERKEDGSSKSIKEVTLPLKDILSVVLLVASFDEDMQRILEQQEDDTGSETSVSTNGAAADPRESVPLIKKILVENSHKKPPNGPNLHESENLQSAYHKSAFSNYLDDCNIHIGQGITPPQEDDGRFLTVKESYIK